MAEYLAMYHSNSRRAAMVSRQTVPMCLGSNTPHAAASATNIHGTAEVLQW